MKICLLSYQTGTQDGGGRFANELRSALMARGHHVDMPRYGGGFFFFTRSIRRERKKYDVIHAIDEHMFGFVAYLATVGTKTPYVITAQGTYAIAPLYNLKTRVFATMGYTQASAVVAISNFTAKLLAKRLPRLQVSVINHGVNDPGSHTVPTAQPPYIFSVGAMKSRKGYEISLRAFAEAKIAVPNLRYIIVGSRTANPGYFACLQDLIKQLKIEASVEFRSGVPDTELDLLYRGATAFILTSVNKGSHFEGFGLVFLEAAIRSVPGIGTFGNGIEDAIQDGVTGILVPQDDVAATRNAIISLVTDTDLRKTMGQNAMQKAREMTWSRAAEAYESIYMNLKQS